MYATKEENRLIKGSILYPLLLTVLNRDLKTISNSSVKFTKPYIDLIESLLNQISHGLFEIKKEMHQKNIKVTEKQKLNESIEYDVYVRGYHEVIRYSTYHLRNQTEALLCRLLQSNTETAAKTGNDDRTC